MRKPAAWIAARTVSPCFSAMFSPHCHAGPSIAGKFMLSSLTQFRSESSQQPPYRNEFGIAFDIDGVLLRGKTPIPGAAKALARLQNPSSLPVVPLIPHVYLTNSGGVTEAVKAAELTFLLNIPVAQHQVLLGHSPFRGLQKRFADTPVLAVGKLDPCGVMKHYGFRRALSMEEYAHLFPHIDALAPHKPWSQPESATSAGGVRVAAVFVLSDPVDWSRDLQVLCDVLTSGGMPGRKREDPPPPLYFAADDFLYGTSFPVPRFGMGAFRVALQAVYQKLTGEALQYQVVGKPSPSAFAAAQVELNRLSAQIGGAEAAEAAEGAEGAEGADLPLYSSDGGGEGGLKRLCMVGDNPATDIRGAIEAGPHWTSVLTRTGVHQLAGNDVTYPAHQVVEDVEAAVEFILERELQFLR